MHQSQHMLDMDAQSSCSLISRVVMFLMLSDWMSATFLDTFVLVSNLAVSMLLTTMLRKLILSRSSSKNVLIEEKVYLVINLFNNYRQFFLRPSWCCLVCQSFLF